MQTTVISGLGALTHFEMPALPKELLDTLTASLNLKEAKAAVKGIAKDIQAAAVEELEKVAAELTDAVDSIEDEVEEFTSALSEIPVMAIMKEAATSFGSTRTSEAWRVREVAALCIHRVIQALRQRNSAFEGKAIDVDALDSRRNPIDIDALESLRSSLQSALMRRAAVEPIPSVRAGEPLPKSRARCHACHFFTLCEVTAAHTALHLPQSSKTVVSVASR